MPPDPASIPLPCLMVGFEGKSAPPLLKRRLREGTVSGVVLFSRNVEGPRQVRELCREIRAAAGKGRPAPFIAIDQEGGRVRRLKDEGFTQFPPARCYGSFCPCQAEAVAEAAGRTMAAELSAVGVDIDFAPVLDVDSNPRNPVIGDRALASDPERVARLGVAFAGGSDARARSPITGLRGLLSTSRTGAKSMSTPKNCAAMVRPAASATASAWQGQNKPLSAAPV